MRNYLACLGIAAFALAVVTFGGLHAAAGNCRLNVEETDAPASKRGEWRSFVITDHQGAEVAVNISRQLKIRFTEENMCLTDDGNGVNLSFPLSDIAGWRMSEEKQSQAMPDFPTGLDDKEICRVLPSIFVYGRMFKVKGCKAGDIMAVYDSGGHLVKRVPSFADDSVSTDCELDLTELPDGVYLIETGGCCFKVLLN